MCLNTTTTAATTTTATTTLSFFGFFLVMNSVDCFSFHKTITHKQYHHQILPKLLLPTSSLTTTGLRAFRLGKNQALFSSSSSSSFSSSLSLPIIEQKEDSNRFDRVAATSAHVDLPCIVTMYGNKYNMTAWAKAHPGGVKVLQRFHNTGQDATRAFEAADHSTRAYEMLKDFEIGNGDISIMDDDNAAASCSSTSCPVATIMEAKKNNNVPRWRNKLFTKEDPIGIHKYTGIFVLLHYIFRYLQILFFDKAAGYGTRHTIALAAGGEQMVTYPPKIIAVLCLLPHCLLSLSSFIFHTVPQERVVGQPMIWKEYRVHNAVFTLRSALSTYLAWTSIVKGHRAPWRRLAVIGSCAGVLAAQIVADIATHRLRSRDQESTTATMPYWEGCSMDTQRRFKHFYAYCQFMATLACLLVGNPAWGLAVMLPIQLASLLMTFVRKGLLSARGYHIGYTITLAMPFFAGISILGVLGFLPYLAFGAMLYHLRRQGINKYALWVPVIAGRIAFGDQIIDYQSW